jgi:hypothetical protein
MNLKSVLKNLKRKKMKMKKSNKILLVAGATPILVIFLLLLATRITLPEDDLKVISSIYNVSPHTTKKIDLAGFNEISAKGDWKIHLIQGDTYKVEIKAKEDMIGRLPVEKRGSILFLGEQASPSTNMNNPTRINIILGKNNDKLPEVTIILPMVSRINLDGMINLDLSGIKNNDLSIHIMGPIEISGSNCTINNISISGTAMSALNLSNINVTNANVDLDGGYTISLLMAGGRLSGRLGGIGKLIYSGNVSENTIQVDNPKSSIIHAPQ